MNTRAVKKEGGIRILGYDERIILHSESFIIKSGEGSGLSLSCMLDNHGVASRTLYH